MTESEYLELLSALKTARINSGMTQDMIANFLDIKRVSYTQIELGAVMLDLKKGIMLCRLFNINPFEYCDANRAKKNIKKVYEVQTKKRIAKLESKLRYLNCNGDSIL